MLCTSPIILAFLDVGGPEFMLIIVVALLLFGGKRMPEVARGMGKALRDFKRAREGVEDQLKRALQEDPVPAKSARKPEPATTTPEDTTIYDEAAAGAAASTAASTSEATDENADESVEDISEDPDDYNYEVDPYEDEYIGGTAESDAGAHGNDDDAPDAPANAENADANADSDSGADANTETPDDAENRKKNDTDQRTDSGDGGGI